MKKISFRDPLSEVYIDGDKVIRKINSGTRSFFIELFKKDFFIEMHKNKWIQNSEIIENDNQISMLHQKIDNFVELTEMSSYQLFLSGLHTINIAINSLNNGYLIKDASAWNVVFFRGKPLFLDIASFETWKNEKVWYGYGQFIRHFIIPLILNKELNIPVSQLFMTSRDGIQPQDAFKQLGIKAFKSTIYLEFVLAPSIFKSSEIKRPIKSML